MNGIEDKSVAWIASNARLLAITSEDTVTLSTVAVLRLVDSYDELLAALRDITAAHEAYRIRNGEDADSSDSVDIARTAIARATGA